MACFAFTQKWKYREHFAVIVHMVANMLLAAARNGLVEKINAILVCFAFSFLVVTNIFLLKNFATPPCAVALRLHK